MWSRDAIGVSGARVAGRTAMTVLTAADPSPAAGRLRRSVSVPPKLIVDDLRSSPVSAPLRSRYRARVIDAIASRATDMSSSGDSSSSSMTPRSSDLQSIPTPPARRLPTVQSFQGMAMKQLLLESPPRPSSVQHQAGQRVAPMGEGTASKWKNLTHATSISRMISESKLSDSAPAHLVEAASDFDRHHEKLCTRTKRVQYALDENPQESDRSDLASAWRRAKNELARERYPRLAKEHDELNDESVVRADYLLNVKWRPFTSDPNSRRIVPLVMAPAVGASQGRRTGFGHDGTNDFYAGRMQSGGATGDGFASGGGLNRANGRLLHGQIDHASMGNRGSARSPMSLGSPIAPLVKGRPMGPSSGDARSGHPLHRRSSGSANDSMAGFSEDQRFGMDPTRRGMMPGEAHEQLGAFARQHMRPVSGRARAGMDDKDCDDPDSPSSGHTSGGRMSGVDPDGITLTRTQSRRRVGGIMQEPNDSANAAGPKHGVGTIGRKSSFVAGRYHQTHADVMGADTEGGQDSAFSGGDGRPGAHRRSFGTGGDSYGGTGHGGANNAWSDGHDSDCSDDTSDFDPAQSIWGPRAEGCDAKDFYDTAKVHMQRFDSDWRRLLALGATREIIRQSKTKGDDVASAEAVDRVSKVMNEHYMSIGILFSYYASYGNELHYLTLNGWTQLTEDFRLVKNSSKFCKKADCDRLFIAVDSMSAVLEREQARTSRNTSHSPSSTKRAVEGEDRQKAMSRVEFMAALIHMAINRYVRTKEMADVAEAVDQLLEMEIAARLHPRTMASPNDFRRQHLYTEEVSYVLEWHEASLHNIFDVLAKNSFGTSSTLVSLGCFRAGMDALGLMNGDLTERDITLCFSWSRMVVTEPRGVGGPRRDSCLPYEGFLEALCRIAALKALPTDDEIAAAGCSDAGSYLVRLQHENSAAYKSLMERKTLWGGKPSHQPFFRCVAHVIAIMIRSVKPVDFDENTADSVSAADATRWNKSEFAPK